MAAILNKMIKISSYQRYQNTSEVLADIQQLPGQKKNIIDPNVSHSPGSSSKIKKIVLFTGIFAILGIAAFIPNILGAVKALGHYERGQQLTEAGDYEKAIAEYNKAISIKPNFAIAWTNRGFAQGKLSRHLDKFSSCAQATNVAPNFAEAWNCKGLARFDLKQYELALQEYDQAIAVDEEFYRGWFNKGQVLIKLGRYEEAIAATRKVLAIQPDYFLAWTQICSAFFELQQYQDAKTNCQQSLAIKKDYKPTIEMMKKIQQKLQ